MTNSATKNEVLFFHRDSNGALSLVGGIPTQGLGTGFTLDPFASEGSLSLSAGGNLLLAINAGSGDVTSFAVSPKGLKFAGKVASHGFFPVSVTGFGNLVYVLNQLGSPNIAGFSADSAGRLQYLAGSTRPFQERRWHSQHKSVSRPMAIN